MEILFSGQNFRWYLSLSIVLKKKSELALFQEQWLTESATDKEFGKMKIEELVARSSKEQNMVNLLEWSQNVK